MKAMVSDMTRVCLDDVAREIKQKASAGQELPTVGLEHLDPGEVELARWDESAETTFTKAFSKGQVLFGRRRAYLRKAAVAPFDGICSGDITVIAAKSSLSPRLLPFIIQNDALFEHAVTNSAGSLSPRVKWQSLSQFEFELPSDDRQEELADILWAAQEAKSHYKQLLKTCDDIVKSQFVEMFGHAESGEFSTLRECCMTIQGGKTPSMKHPEYYGGGIPFIKSGDVKQDIVSKGALSLTERALTDAGVKLVPNDSVLVVTRSAMLHNKMYSALSACRLAINQDVKAFIPLPDYLSSYLLWAIRVHEQELLAGTRSVSTCALDFEQLCSIEVQKAPIQRQEAFASFVSQVDKSKFAVQKALDELNAMTKKIMNQELGLGDV